MDKKDIYEHLANIYLDASLNKNRKSKKGNGFRKLLIGNILVLALVFSSFLFFNIYSKSNRTEETSQIALILYPDVAKINFNFDPAKKEIYAIKLKNLNLSHYRSVAFAIKKSNYANTISLRVEFSNSYKEKSFIYLKDIPNKWQDYAINFKDFKNITDWSDMSNLSFIVEEWNSKEKSDIVYLDNIRVLR